MTAKSWLALPGALLLTITMAASFASAIASGDAIPFVRGSWSELRKAHSGHPAVVHFWGLTCAPCLAELPEWTRLTKDHPGLDLVLVHAERLPSEPGRVAATLAKVGLDSAESWVFSDTYEERLRFEIDKEWHGELPRTILIGRDGTVTSLAGVADMSQIRGWLDGQGAAK